MAYGLTTVAVLWRLKMAGKKQTDATQNLPPGEPTQVLPEGTKTGLPKRRDVMALIDRLSGKKTS